MSNGGGAVADIAAAHGADGPPQPGAATGGAEAMTWRVVTEDGTVLESRPGYWLVTNVRFNAPEPSQSPWPAAAAAPESIPLVPYPAPPPVAQTWRPQPWRFEMQPVIAPVPAPAPVLQTLAPVLQTLVPAPVLQTLPPAPVLQTLAPVLQTLAPASVLQTVPPWLVCESASARLGIIRPICWTCGGAHYADECPNCEDACSSTSLQPVQAPVTAPA